MGLGSIVAVQLLGRLMKRIHWADPVDKADRSILGSSRGLAGSTAFTVIQRASQVGQMSLERGSAFGIKKLLQ